MKKTKSWLEHTIGLLALKSMCNPMFKSFSWNRVRVALANIDKCEAYYLKSGGIRIDFVYHQHSIELYPNGRGFICNLWNYTHSDVKYKVLAPHDVQAAVKELCTIYSTPIPINMNLN